MKERRGGKEKEGPVNDTDRDNREREDGTSSNECTSFYLADSRQMQDGQIIALFRGEGESGAQIRGRITVCLSR